MTSLYALLVGIDQYDARSKISPLRGCTNDIKAIKAYLEERTARDRQLHIRMLLDEQATRQAILDGFRNYLQQAQAGDMVLFYYAGHGSQDRAPKEFWEIDPDRLNETLVCYDSRTEGVWDLADKELAKLIAEVSDRNPHITVILDCCHSGSGTRFTNQQQTFAKRQAPMDERDRPLSSFLVSSEDIKQQAKQHANSAGSRTRSAGSNAPQSGWKMPQGRHVLMAACRDREEASEYSANNRHCGAFSHFLLDTLQSAKGSLTYRDLFKATHSKICAQISNQSPQLEAPFLEDIDRPFLGGAIAESPTYFTLTHSSQQGWVIDGGAVHGIQQSEAARSTNTPHLMLFPLDATAKQMAQLETAIAQATIVQVQSHLSKVQITTALDPSTIYKARLTGKVMTTLNVVLNGQTESIERVRQSLRNPEKLAQTIALQEVSDIESAQYQVAAEAGSYIITRLADGRQVAKMDGQTADSANAAIEALAHIARWTNLAERSPSEPSQLPGNAVELQIYQDGRRLEGDRLQLSYQQQGQEWIAPRFKAKLVNHTSHRLYCSLLNLTEEYSVSTPFFGSGGVWLEPYSEIGATVVAGAQLTDQIPTEVPQSLLAQGITQYQDILKLIASTQEFDPKLFSQPKLMNRTRDIAAVSTVPMVKGWATSQVIIETVKPQADVRISDQSAVAIADSSMQNRSTVVIQAHPQLRAIAKLTPHLSPTAASRSTDRPALSPTLLEQTQPLTLTARRGDNSELGALELSEVEQAESVTPSSPLTLLVDAPLASNEAVLPVAYDGEFFIPLGYGHAKGEQTEVVLQQLPQAANGEGAVGTRSLSGSFKILFRKIAKQALGDTISQKIGLSFEYPILAAVKSISREDKQVSYLTNTEEIEALVSKAKNIAIYVHGITGDSQSLVPSIQTARAEVDGQSRALEDIYDLVLAYDYESINTSIAENAVLLKRKLAAVGIVPGHDKTVHIVAHSMGGLVSRWLIEKERGDEFIDYLMMLGTPNAGSPWPVVQAGLTRALCFAINGLSTVAWPLSLISGVLGALETVDVALDEMQPGSDTLSLLAASEPPMAYSIVAGNVALIPADDKTDLRSRLGRKLDKIAALPFLNADHDTAVSVSSIKQVPTGRAGGHQSIEIGCDHTSYFNDPVGLAGFGWAVTQAFENRKVHQLNAPSSISS